MEMGTGSQRLLSTRWARCTRRGDNTALVIALGKARQLGQERIPAHLPERIQTKIVKWQPNFTKKFREAIQEIADPEKRGAGFPAHFGDEHRSI